MGKFVEYDFKLHRFINLYQKHKFYNSPEIKKNKYCIFPPKVLKPKDFRSEVISCINPLIKLPDFKWNCQNIRKVVYMTII